MSVVKMSRIISKSENIVFISVSFAERTIAKEIRQICLIDNSNYYIISLITFNIGLIYMS